MTRSLIAACLVFLAACSFTAGAELLPAQAGSLASAVLGQQREIEVFLPKDHEKDPARRYETIYVLDGDWNAKLVVQTVDFLQSTGFMPPVIVVSVPNHFDDKGVNSRDRDLTPTPLSNEARSGGAPQFTMFLENELIPYVSQHYPSNGVNLVHGHSYGGLFLNYVIATDPAIFDGYLILDPAMWWDNKTVSRSLAETLPSMRTQDKAIFIAGRAGSAFKGMAIDSLESAYANAPPALHWQITAFPNETHDSLKFKATYDGLRYLYRGYSQDEVKLGPDAGIFDPALPFPLEAETDRFDIHYTSDGSTPTTASPKIDHTLAVSDPTRLRLKLIAMRSHYDQDLALHLKRGALWKPVRKAKADQKSTSRHAIYAPDQWPRFRGSPVKSGTTDDGDFSGEVAGDFAGIADTDYVVAEDGYYLFVLNTPGPARITLNGKRIIEHGGADDHRYSTFVVPLGAGIHTVRCAFRYKQGDPFDFNVFQFKNGTWDNVVK